MNTIKKIGNAALERVFKHHVPNPTFETECDEVVVRFPRKELNLLKPSSKRNDEHIVETYRPTEVLCTSMAIWGIQLGLIRFDVKDGKIPLEEIIDNIKLQRVVRYGILHCVPSHIVKISHERMWYGDVALIYRLSQKQEEMIADRLRKEF